MLVFKGVILMENTCSKCGNNLYGNRLKCPFCGEAIGPRPMNSSRERSNNSSHKSTHSGGNTYSYASKPVRKSSKPTFGLLEIIVLLLVSFFVPPFGVIFFFGFSKEQSTFAFLALVAGFFGFITYIN